MTIKTVTAADIAASVAPAPTETKPEPKPEAEPPKEKEGHNSFQKRIDELTREKKELDELARDEYERRIATERRLADLEKNAKKPEPIEDKRPNRAEYTTEQAEKYENDLLEWNKRQTLKAFQEQQAIERAQANLAASAVKARETYSDFDEVISTATARGDQTPPHVSAAIHESEYGAHLAYYLAKHPMEARKIAGLPVAKALMALGKIETKLQSTEPASKDDSAKETPKPQTSKAPPPAPDLQGVVTQNADLTGLAFSDYKRRRLEQMRKR